MCTLIWIFAGPTYCTLSHTWICTLIWIFAGLCHTVHYLTLQCAHWSESLLGPLILNIISHLNMHTDLNLCWAYVIQYIISHLNVHTDLNLCWATHTVHYLSLECAHWSESLLGLCHTVHYLTLERAHWSESLMGPLIQYIISHLNVHTDLNLWWAHSYRTMSYTWMCTLLWIFAGTTHTVHSLTLECAHWSESLLGPLILYIISHLNMHTDLNLCWAHSYSTLSHTWMCTLIRNFAGPTHTVHYLTLEYAHWSESLLGPLILYIISHLNVHNDQKLCWAHSYCTFSHTWICTLIWIFAGPTHTVHYLTLECAHWSEFLLGPIILYIISHLNVHTDMNLCWAHSYSTLSHTRMWALIWISVGPTHTVQYLILECAHWSESLLGPLIQYIISHLNVHTDLNLCCYVILYIISHLNVHTDQNLCWAHSYSTLSHTWMCTLIWIFAAMSYCTLSHTWMYTLIRIFAGPTHTVHYLTLECAQWSESLLGLCHTVHYLTLWLISFSYVCRTT